MARLARHVVLFVGLVVWTWTWFFPVGGFHHMFRCGVLGWAVLDGENEALELRWSGTILAVSLACWLAGVVAVIWARRYRDRLRGRMP